MYTCSEQVSGESEQTLLEVFFEDGHSLPGVNSLFVGSAVDSIGLEEWHWRPVRGRVVAGHPSQLVSVDQPDSFQLVKDGKVGPVHRVATVHVSAHHEVVQTHPDQLGLEAATER